jgi:hypothetical protein
MPHWPNPTAFGVSPPSIPSRPNRGRLAWRDGPPRHVPPRGVSDWAPSGSDRPRGGAGRQPIAGSGRRLLPRPCPGHRRSRHDHGHGREPGGDRERDRAGVPVAMWRIRPGFVAGCTDYVGQRDRAQSAFLPMADAARATRIERAGRWGRHEMRRVNMTAATVATGQPDLRAIKGRQQLTWSSGNYARIGNMILPIAEQLCEAVDLRANQRVLDVAAGNGNASLAAARRFGDVTAVDYVPALLEDGRRRAAAEQLRSSSGRGTRRTCPSRTRRSTSCCPPWASCSPPDQSKAASELLRSAVQAGRSGWPTGHPRASLGPCSGPSPATSRHRSAPRPQCAGETRTQSPSFWATA